LCSRASHCSQGAALGSPRSGVASDPCIQSWTSCKSCLKFLSFGSVWACPAIALATAGLWLITLRELTVKSACSVKRNPCPNILLGLLCLPCQLVPRSVAGSFSDGGWARAILNSLALSWAERVPHCSRTYLLFCSNFFFINLKPGSSIFCEQSFDSA
jgi:hypothetical protein